MIECYAIVNQDYDGTTIVGVYERREDADAVLATVHAYCDANERPRSPPYEESDEKWKKFERAEKRWRKRHPFGEEHAYYERSFSVWPLPFHPATEKAEGR